MLANFDRLFPAPFPKGLGKVRNENETDTEVDPQLTI
jgi:hypothetical protein